MTGTTIVRYIRRSAGDRRPVDQLFCLGEACFQPGKGWKFHPRIAGRIPSRKFHATLEACLPRWLGYPDGCESYYTRYNGALVSPDWRAPAPELRDDVNADLLAALRVAVDALSDARQYLPHGKALGINGHAGAMAMTAIAKAEGRS